MWKDHLTDEERAELDAAQAKRDEAKAVYNALATRLINRAKQRIIRAKGK